MSEHEDDLVIPRPDVTLHCRAFGSGPPLLLLSGGPGGSCEELLPVAHALAADCRVYLLEQRATGRSTLASIDTESIRMANYVADVEAVRDHLGLEHWSLLGHSAGGGLAMSVAAAHPNHVANLILVETSGIDLEFLEYAPGNLRHTDADRDAMNHWMDPEQIDQDPRRAGIELHKAWLAGSLFDRAGVAALTERYVHEPNLFRVAELMMQDLIATSFDLRPQLASFDAPCLIVQGREGYMGPRVGEQIRSCLPNARLAVIDQCGHYPMFEQEEAFYAEVRRFVGAHFAADRSH